MGKNGISELCQISDFGKQKHRVLLQTSWEREPKGSRGDKILVWNTNILDMSEGSPDMMALEVVKNDLKARAVCVLGVWELFTF